MISFQKKLLPLALLPLALASCGLFKGNSFPKKFENVKIQESRLGDGYGPAEPSIAVSPANPKNVVGGAILNRCYRSTDGGKTWDFSKIKSPHGVFGDPVLLADWQGNFYFSHLSDPEGAGWASDSLLHCIVVQKSSDGGQTWSPGGCLGGTRHPHDQDKPWLAADTRTGLLACAWTEFDKYASKKSEDHSRILFATSRDGGQNWSEPLKISDLEGDCLDDDLTTEGATPAFGPNGEIYLTWGFDGKIWFDRSLDGGKTWLPHDLVAAEQPGGWSFNVPGIERCNGMPVLVCDLSNGPNRGTLYLNWADQRNGPHDTDIWLSKSTDGGNTWSPAKRVNNDKAGKQQFFTWMAIDQTTGHLYVVFYDRRKYDDEQTDVYLAVSQDGGATFKNLKISALPFTPNATMFFGDYNGLSAHGGVVRPIWTRMDGKVLSVWTALIDLGKR